MSWEELGSLVAVLSPLAGVPLVMITLYLRAIREHQTNATEEMMRRIHTIETSMSSLLRRMGEFDREYATKEEWVRESMVVRQRLEHLTGTVTKIEVELESGQGLAAELGRATAAMVELVKHLAEVSPGRACRRREGYGRS